MAGAHEVGGAGIVVGEIAHRRGAVLGRNAGGGAVLVVDRDGEGGAVRRVVVGHHRREAQPVRASRAVIGVHTMPEVLRMMNAIFSGVACTAATSGRPRSRGRHRR